MKSSSTGIISTMPNMRLSRRIWRTSFRTTSKMRASDASIALLQTLLEAGGAERDDGDREHHQQHRLRPQHLQADALQIDAANRGHEVPARKAVGDDADRGGQVLQREDEAREQHRRQERE